uniref:Uncharacterized protein n=1 Tax=Glossina brevipalpis TaxID=37001 RepID=A0A1A9W6R3_9MUSC
MMKESFIIFKATNSRIRSRLRNVLNVIIVISSNYVGSARSLLEYALLLPFPFLGSFLVQLLYVCDSSAAPWTGAPVWCKLIPTKAPCCLFVPLKWFGLHDETTKIYAINHLQIV